MLARLWGISPAQLRDCTARDVDAMWEVLDVEAELRKRKR